MHAFVPKIYYVLTNFFMWQGIINALHCKASYGEGLGNGKEERDRSIKTGVFLYPVIVLIDLVLLLNPKGSVSMYRWEESYSQPMCKSLGSN